MQSISTVKDQLHRVILSKTVNRTLKSEIWARISSHQPSVPDRFLAASVSVRAPLALDTIKITLLCESQLVYGNIIVCGLPLSDPSPPPPIRGLLNFPKCGVIKAGETIPLQNVPRQMRSVVIPSGAACVTDAETGRESGIWWVFNVVGECVSAGVRQRRRRRGDGEHLQWMLRPCVCQRA